jgi:hypothetical protein
LLINVPKGLEPETIEEKVHGFGYCKNVVI